MNKAPALLRATSIAWLFEGALLIRFCYVFFTEIGTSGGPDTGGLILVIPVALAAPLISPACLFFAWALDRGRAVAFIKLLSGVGLVLVFLIGGPVSLVLILAMAIVFFSGFPLEATSLGALPVLFAITFIVLHTTKVSSWLEARKSGAAEAPPVLLFAAIALLVVPGLTFGVPALIKSINTSIDERAKRNAPPPPSPEELQRNYAIIEAAVKADDPAPLTPAPPAAWDDHFFLPAQSQSGDALALAIELGKPRAVEALVKQQHRIPLSYYLGPALQYGTEAEWKVLDDAKADLARDDGALAGSLERKDLDGLRYLVAHGADKSSLLEDAVAGTQHPKQKEMVAYLLRAGADANTTGNRRARDLPHDPMLVIAVHNKDLEVARILLEAGADPSRQAEPARMGEFNHPESALDAVASMEATEEVKAQFRALLESKGKPPAAPR